MHNEEMSESQPILSQPDPTTETPTEGPSETKSTTRKPRAPDTLVRGPGKSILPYSRVQKILKADKDLIMVQREAAFCISRAAEDFVQLLVEAAQRVAERERRATVQTKDLVTSIRRAEEFAFLEELIPWMDTETTRKPRAEAEKTSGKGSAKSTILDQFVKKSANDDVEDGGGPQMTIVTNEDGTMSMVPAE